MPVTLHPAHTPAALAQDKRKHPATRLREARILQWLVADGYSAAEIAGFAQLSEGRVKESLSLLALPAEGQRAMEDGTLRVGLALAIAQLTPVNQQVMVTRWLAGGFRDDVHALRYVRTVRRDEAGL